MASCKVTSAIYIELDWLAFPVLMRGCQTDNTKIWWFWWKGTIWEEAATIPFSRNQWTVVKGRPQTQSPSSPFSSGMACSTGTLRWPRQLLLRGHQGCGTEKRFVCREGNLSWITAIYSTVLSLHITCNIWHIIIIYYMQCIARISLTSLWNVPAGVNVWGGSLVTGDYEVKGLTNLQTPLFLPPSNSCNALLTHSINLLQ